MAHCLSVKAVIFSVFPNKCFKSCFMIIGEPQASAIANVSAHSKD